ncbi:piggyBac transposable element-derived protein 4-like [Vespula squamosa]|uniref:PiggyBac transposable element-derived protein 4-like n=1 Tax=Vespula squamosa TaxID=30214 RepID=A0ABD2BXU2_VESSQ
MNKDQISSSSDEFNFSTLNKQITSIHDGLRFGMKESSGEDSDEVKGLRQRRIRIIDSESEIESETAEDANSLEWELCGQYEKVAQRAQFISGEHPTGPHIPSNIIFETGEHYSHIRYGEVGVMLRTQNSGHLLLILDASFDDHSNKQYESEITPATNYINSKFLDYFIPGVRIYVDESTVKFKGRISCITYNPKKPTKWYIRIYTLADSNTSYICCILPYYGSLTTELLVKLDLPVSSRIPIHLYKMLLEKNANAQGHHMYTDRYYTSYVLAQELAKLKCHITGTILTNWKELPSAIKKPTFVKKTPRYLTEWKDKRLVTCLHEDYRRIIRGGVEMMIKKPNIILNYIKYIGGVDRADQYASTCFLRKSV